jgi:hypothetical protein
MTFPDLAFVAVPSAGVTVAALFLALFAAAALVLVSSGVALAAGRKGAGGRRTGKGRGARKAAKPANGAGSDAGAGMAGTAASPSGAASVNAAGKPRRVKIWHSGGSVTPAASGLRGASGQDLFGNLPDWDFLPMGNLAESVRNEAEQAFAERDFRSAAINWSTLRPLVSLACGPDDPRGPAALARAARAFLLVAEEGLPGGGSLRRRPAETDEELDELTEAESCLGNASLFASRALAGKSLPAREMHFAVATRDAAERLATKAGFDGPASPDAMIANRAEPYFRHSGWDLGDMSRGFPGDPSLPTGPGPDALAGELQEAERRRGQDSAGWLAVCSRLGDALAARAMDFPFAPGTGRRPPQEELLEAERLLRQGAEGLERLLGAENLHTQDAMARLALFLSSESGPLPLLAGPNCHRPEPECLDEAEELWQRIGDATGDDSPGRARQILSSLREADCVSMQGFASEAFLLRKLAEFTCQVYGDDTGPPKVWDMLLLYGMGESALEEGRLDDAASYLAFAKEGFEELLGSSHRLAVRATCRLADLQEAKGNEPAAASFRALAAEDLDAPAPLLAPWKSGSGKVPGPRPVQGAENPESPDAHYLRCLAASVFLKHGDLAVAEAVLDPAAEALERLLGGEDPRTLRAKGWLEKARNPMEN